MNENESLTFTLNDENDLTSLKYYMLKNDIELLDDDRIIKNLKRILSKGFETEIVLNSFK